MPEGDSLHRAAGRLQVLAGQRVEVETPHPRARRRGSPSASTAARSRRVEAVGKNLLLRFEGGLVLRSHLRMTGRWRVEPRGARRARAAVARAARRRGRGGALERAGARARKGRRPLAHLGPDILDRPPDLDAMIERFRGEPRTRAVGDALLDQRLVAGIGNMWKAEALWEARVSPWRPLADAPTSSCAPPSTPRPRCARASTAGARRAPRLPPRRPRVPALRHVIRSPQGDGAGSPTGAPAAKEEEERSPGRSEGSVVRSPHSTTRCAGSASARSPRSTRISTRAPTSRSRSRSTGRTGGRRSTSTARSCAASSRRARERLFARDDVRQAVADLQREPAARIFARAHDTGTRRGARALPLGARAARSCAPPKAAAASTGTTARSTARTRSSRSRSTAKAIRTARSRRSSASRAARTIELGDGIRVRAAAAGELAAMWPEASGLLPRDFGREPDRLCVLELERSLEKGASDVPDAPGELADAVTALRLATEAPVAAGPVLFERLDWRPYGIRPCCRSPRPRRPASRRGSTRSVRRSPRSSALSSRSPTTTRSSATRSTAGSSRSSRTTRSAASS